MRKLLNILFLFVSVVGTAQDRIDWDQIKAATAAGYMVRSVGVNGAWTDSLRFLSGNLTITGGLKITSVTGLTGDSVLVWRGNQVYRRSLGAALSTYNSVYGTGSTGLLTEWLNDSTLTFDATGAYQLSVGTDAQRPTGAAGLTRYNSTNGNLEYYGAAAWEYPVKSSYASGLGTSTRIPFFDANGRIADDADMTFINGTDGPVILGDITAGSSTSDAGVGLTGSGAYSSALITEVDGEVLSYAINTPQVVSPRVSTRAGGIFRMDIREGAGANLAAYTTPGFSVLHYIDETSTSFDFDIIADFATNNIYLAPEAGKVRIGSSSLNAAPAYTLDILQVDGIRIANGTVAQRPTGADAVIRGNTDSTNVEYYYSGAWRQIAARDWARTTFATASSGAANRVAYWSGSGTITSTANWTFDGTTSVRTGTSTATSGTTNVNQYTATFAPTSGTGVFNGLNLSNTINQTGGANGITRALLISPTLTAAADYRAIELQNNTGWGYYQSGTASNYFAGELRLNDVTSGAATSVIGRDAEGDVVGVTIGSGLSLAAGSLTATAASYTSWTLAGDSGTQTIADGNTATFTGGWGINTAASATDVLTVTVDSAEVATQYDILQTTQGWLDGAGAAGRIAYYSDANTLANEDALFYDAANNRLAVNDATPDYTLDLDGNTDAAALPVGTTAQRPTNQAGLIRWNTTVPQLEFADGSVWTAITGSAADGNGIYTGNGSLSGNTTVSAGASKLTISTATAAAQPFAVVATTGTAMTIDGTTGVGLTSTVTGSNLSIRAGTHRTATNSVGDALGVISTSTGTAAAGLGGALSFYTQTASGSLPNTGRVIVELTDATNGAHAAEMELWTSTAGSLAKAATLTSTTAIFEGTARLGGSSGPLITYGTGTPEGAVTAGIGSLFLRTDGGANTTLYVKESGAGNTGWIAK